MKAVELPDLLEKNVAYLESGCIEWTRARDKDGYGIAKSHGVTYKAHRAAWMLARGPIPEGLVVRHSCDNPPCVNVEPVDVHIGFVKTEQPFHLAGDGIVFADSPVFDFDPDGFANVPAHLLGKLVGCFAHLLFTYLSNARRTTSLTDSAFSAALLCAALYRSWGMRNDLSGSGIDLLDDEFGFGRGLRPNADDPFPALDVEHEGLECGLRRDRLFETDRIRAERRRLAAIGVTNEPKLVLCHNRNTTSVITEVQAQMLEVRR